MTQTTAEKNQEVASRLSNDLSRLLHNFSRDFDSRIGRGLSARGYRDVRPSHIVVFATLGSGAVRVKELAELAQVTQQAMGKMLKELERMGYVARDIDGSDKRAKAIRLTERGTALARDLVSIVAETRAYYASRMGEDELSALETGLRRALRELARE